MARLAKTTVALAILVAAASAFAAPRPSPNYVVRGQVSQANNSPVAGHIVRLVDKTITGETVLGEGISDAAGRYQISYPAPPRWDQGDRPSVIVRVFAPSGGSAALAQSAVIYNVTPALAVNLTVVGAPAARPRRL